MTRTRATLAATAALCALSATGAVAQDFGPRDIGGTWERYPVLGGGMGSGVESEPGAPPPPPRAPQPPLKPDYVQAWRAEQEQIAALTASGAAPADAATRCIGDGMPGMMGAPFPIEVLVTDRPDGRQQVTVIAEAYNQVRRIYVGQDAPPPEDSEPRFAGNSGAHWDGDTLVVETTGVKPYVEYRGAPHSSEMRITERISLMDNRDYMQNQVTITDPEFLTGPWSWTFMYKRWADYEIQEYICEDDVWGATEGDAALSLDLGGE